MTKSRIALMPSPRRIAVVLLGLLLSACAAGPDYHRPTLPQPAAFTRAPLPSTIGSAAHHDAQQFAADMAITANWWQLFGSPALDALVQRALARNPGIDGAQAALRQAQENVAAQRSTYLPSAQLNYSPSRQQNAVGTLAPTLNSGQPLYTLHTAQLSISYAPDVFGLNRRAVESLQAQADAQRYQLQAARLTLSTNVVLAAIQLGALRAQIDATQLIIDADRRSLVLLEQQHRLGGASGLDVATQESALAQAQQTLPPLQKQWELTRDLLAVLAGDPPADGGNTDLALTDLQLPHALPLSLPSQLLEQRPDVRAAEAELVAANAAVGIAVANRLPQLSLSAIYGGSSTRFTQMFSDDNVFWSLTGGVSQTVLDFGALKHRQRAAEAGWQQARAQYRATVLTAFQNVADTLYALDADARALAAADTAMFAARRTLTLTQQQLRFGAIGALPLLAAEQADQQARIAQIQARAARFSDTVALLQALGGGWQNAAPERETHRSAAAAVSPASKETKP